MALGSRKRNKTPRSSPPDPMPPPSASARGSKAAAAAVAVRRRCGRWLCFASSLVALSLFLLYVAWEKFVAISVESPPPATDAAAAAAPADFYSIEVVNEFPHDPKAFTQGLVYGGNETLYESTGLYHRSSVRQVFLQSGKVEVHHQMDGSFFGEGLTLLGERLFQVTWLTRTGFIYDRKTLSERKKFIHQMRDGWGLATDGKVLFGSDGSSTLYQLDPENLEVTKRVIVKHKGREVTFLNELEFINGEVWANVWQTDCIARISPEDGTVRSWILLHGLRQSLLNSGHSTIDVLNGIAWDGEKMRLFVTGKLWPKLYEIKLHPVTGPLKGRIEDLCHLSV